MTNHWNNPGAPRTLRSMIQGGSARVTSSPPLVPTQEPGQVPLPAVGAPSLENLEVRVPAPDDLTEDEVAERFHELVREHALKRDRDPGEPVQPGDDVQLDVVGYAQGRVIPFSARADVWMELEPIPALPGFTEGIAGTPVGEVVEVRLTLPVDYPVASLRGVAARFAVSVKAAREVAMPDPESPELLEQLGRGTTLQEVMASLVEDLEEELADLLWIEAQDLVLDEVARRARVTVPAALVDEEIRRRWHESERGQLAELGLDEQEQREALDGWLKDPATRQEAERRLCVGLALRAVVQAEGLELTPERMEELFHEAVETYGMDPEEARKALETDPNLTEHIRNVAWHLMAVHHVMDKATIEFEGAGG